MNFVLKRGYERSYRSSSEEGKVKSLRIRALSHKLIARCHSVRYLPSSYIYVMCLIDSSCINKLFYISPSELLTGGL